MKGAKRLPSTLHNALRLLETSKVLKEGLGDDLVQAYIKLKMQEWTLYMGHLSDWGRRNTLDC